MASRNFLLGLLFSILVCVGSAHRLLIDTDLPLIPKGYHPKYPSALLTTTANHHEYPDSRHSADPPTTSHHQRAYLHSHHPAYAPANAYSESYHPSYPPRRWQNAKYTLGTRPFPLSPPTPPPSPSTIPPLAAAAPLTGDNKWTWTYKASAPLASIDRTIPVIWPDLGGASQDPFASQLNYVYEEPPPSKKND